MLYLSDVLKYLLENTNDANLKQVEDLNKRIESMEKKIEELEDKIAKH